MELEVLVPQGGYLVLSEIAYPGWRAEVNGEERPILQANYLLRAVWLDPGLHKVSMVYQPVSVWLGIAISLASLVGLVLWLAVIPLGRRALSRAG